MAVFGTIHECGHAVYEQNIAEKFEGTPLCSGTSMGIHESQSLFFENFIGRNKSFWKNNYDLLKEYSDGQFNDISVDEFYDAINESKPSFIRIEADELTYPLHVMVRYELEKELFDGTLQVKDLPAAWNDKMEAYLEFVRLTMHKAYYKMFTGLVVHLDTSHLMRLAICMQRNLSKEW